MFQNHGNPMFCDISVTYFPMFYILIFFQ
jgi:hypothetical protein